MVQRSLSVRLCCVLEFRECFHLYARQRQVRSVDELAVIMRSLRLSPTSTELRRYLKQKGEVHPPATLFHQPCRCDAAKVGCQCNVSTRRKLKDFLFNRWQQKTYVQL